MKAGGTSWLPVAGAVALIGGMFIITVNEDPEHGKYGPKLRYGLPNPKEKFYPGAPSDHITFSVTAEVLDDNFLAPFPTADQRAGLEFVGWNAVALRPIDDSYPVKILSYGFMDHLSGMSAANGVESPVPARQENEWRLVTTYPNNNEPLPLPVSRVLALQTEQVEQGETPADGFSATVRVAVIDPAAQSVVAPSGLVPQAGIQEAEYRFVIEAQATQPMQWTAFNATGGRKFASEALQTLFGGDGTWPVVPQDAQLLAEQGLADGTFKSWHNGLAKQPGDKVLDWLAPFQLPLVRGWSGEIRGETFAKKGQDHKAIDLLRDRLLGRGGWEAVPDDSGAAGLNFNRTLADTYGRLHAQPRPFGWGVVVWQEHPAPEAQVMQWISSVNDAIGLAQIRRHLYCQGFLSQTRDQMAAVLEPVIGDPAVAVAVDQQGPVGQVAAWLRGQTAEVASEALATVPEIATEAAADAIRVWRRYDDGRVVLLVRDLFNRMSVYSRIGSEAPMRWSGAVTGVETSFGVVAWPAGQAPRFPEVP